MGSPPNRLPITPSCREYLLTEVLPRAPIDYSRGQILGMAKTVVTELFKAKKAGHAFIIRRGPPHNYKAFFDIVRAWGQLQGLWIVMAYPMHGGCGEAVYTWDADSPCFHPDSLLFLGLFRSATEGIWFGPLSKWYDHAAYFSSLEVPLIKLAESATAGRKCYELVEAGRRALTAHGIVAEGLGFTIA